MASTVNSGGGKTGWQERVQHFARNASDTFKEIIQQTRTRSGNLARSAKTRGGRLLQAIRSYLKGEDSFEVYEEKYKDMLGESRWSSHTHVDHGLDQLTSNSMSLGNKEWMNAEGPPSQQEAFHPEFVSPAHQFIAACRQDQAGMLQFCQSFQQQPEMLLQFLNTEDPAAIPKFLRTVQQQTRQLPPPIAHVVQQVLDSYELQENYLS